MPTPTNRTPLRVARGTYSNLNSSVADIQEGEICYATDQDKLYVKEGAALVNTQGVSLGTAQTFTALQTMNAGIAVDGPYKQTAETVGALDINLSTGNYFKKSISTSSAVTFSNPPASGTVGSFTLELVLTGSSTAITWPNTVYWNGDTGQTAPTLVDARTHLFMFVTTDGGTKYRGAVLSNYTG